MASFKNPQDIRRLHNSKELLSNLEFLPQSPRPAFKPRGLWYTDGNDWVEWCRSNWPTQIGAYTSEIELAKSARILGLHDHEDVMAFSREYGTGEHNQLFRVPWFNKNTPMENLIHWDRVAESYDGIEVSALRGYPKNENYWVPFVWQEYWDVPSGCIWTPEAIDRINLVEMPTLPEQAQSNQRPPRGPLPMETYRAPVIQSAGSPRL